MNQALTFDTRAGEATLTKALARYVAASGLEIGQALKNQARLLLRDLIDFTPPNGNSNGGKRVTPRREGMNAVKRDIARAIAPLREEDFENPKIKELIRRRQYSALEQIFSRMHSGPSAKLSVRPFNPSMHQSARDNRGRVRGKTRVSTPDLDLLDQYTKRIQERVGMAKGGWAAAFAYLGGRPANWIARHAAQGTFEDQTKSSAIPYIDLINRSPWARSTGDEDRQLRRAIESRAIAIGESIRHAAQKAARKAGVS